MQVQAQGALLQALLQAMNSPARPQSPPTAAAASTTPHPPIGPAAAAPTMAPATLAPSVSMLVTLSQAVEARPRDPAARARAHARDGLDLLSGLYRDQVSGLSSPRRLQSLRDWARRRLRPDDPELAAILEEIEIRLLVELAKAGQDTEEDADDPASDPAA